MTTSYGGSEDRSGAASDQGTFKFPAFNPNLSPYDEREEDELNESGQPGDLADHPPGHHRQRSSTTVTTNTGSSWRWAPRREVTVGPRWLGGMHSQQNNGGHNPTGRHGRQKSLSEAIRTIRTRRGSVSQNAHELADALKAPVSPTLVGLCCLWYVVSISSSTSSKAILNALPKPITLTFIQFGFVSSWCLFLARCAKTFPILKVWMPVLKHEIRPPTRDLLMTTLPLTAFQIGGHILTSDATSRIPVSLVHTIKGLSPLFTVLAYRFIYHIHYRPATYLSLIPLTLGVIMATSADFRGNFWGVFAAFASTFIFVTQNIVSKKLFNEAAQAEADGMPQVIRHRKPDKLNLLCYASGLGFILTFPLWLWSEGLGLIGDILTSASVNLTDKPGSLDHGRLALEFVFNGTFHFSQSLVAFVLLGMVSPVTYSVASLIKRVAVICFALLWFGNPITRIQASGIASTFIGLYLYDRTSDAAKADRRARVQQLRQGTSTQDLLPLRNPRDFVFPPPNGSNTSNAMLSASGGRDPMQYTESPIAMSAGPNSITAGFTPQHATNGYVDTKKSDDTIASANGPGAVSGGRARGQSMAAREPRWQRAGTRQEDTWRGAGDGVVRVS